MMKFLMISIGTTAMLFFAPHAISKNTYSAQQCNNWFNVVDRNNDGSIGASENADAFLARITLGSDTEGSSDSFIMSKAFFVAECKIGSLGKPSS
jgi:hypothetical protein